MHVLDKLQEFIAFYTTAPKRDEYNAKNFSNNKDYLNSNPSAPINYFNAQLLLASFVTGQEFYARRNAIANLEISFMHTLDRLEKFSPFYTTSESRVGDVAFMLENQANVTVRELNLHTSPVGKITLPKYITMNKKLYPQVIQYIIHGNYVDAVWTFRDEIIKTFHLSDILLDKIKYVGCGLGVISVALTTYQVLTSDNPYKEGLHQATLAGGSILGGYVAGAAATPVCAFTGPFAPICIGGAVIVGGVSGAVVTENVVWMKAEASVA